MEYSLPFQTNSLDNLASVALHLSHKQVYETEPSEYSHTELLRDIEQYADEYNLTKIGSGSSRIIFSPKNDSNVIVKIPLMSEYTSGIEQNRVESYIWEHLPTNYSHKFFEVIDTEPNNQWTIMKKADITEGDEKFDAEQASVNMFLSLNVPDGSEFVRSENIGYCETDNEYKCLDYGSYIPKQFVIDILGKEHWDAIGDEHISGSLMFC